MINCFIFFNSTFINEGWKEENVFLHSSQIFRCCGNYWIVLFLGDSKNCFSETIWETSEVEGNVWLSKLLSTTVVKLRRLGVLAPDLHKCSTCCEVRQPLLLGAERQSMLQSVEEVLGNVVHQRLWFPWRGKKKKKKELHSKQLQLWKYFYLSSQTFEP